MHLGQGWGRPPRVRTQIGPMLAPALTLASSQHRPAEPATPAMPSPLPGCHPQKQTLPSHSSDLGGPVFTRMLVPLNWPITALTKFFICLKSLWPMLPEPSMRKTMSISWCGHSAERAGRSRDACVGTSHLRGPRKPSPSIDAGGCSGHRNQLPHGFPQPLQKRHASVIPAPSPLSGVPAAPLFPQGLKRRRRK